MNALPDGLSTILDSGTGFNALQDGLPTVLNSGAGISTARSLCVDPLVSEISRSWDALRDGLSNPLDSGSGISTARSLSTIRALRCGVVFLEMIATVILL